MTSTIKVNTITTESGSTLTVGGCGKTVALASGASQTGFGRTGTVNWVTTIQTSTPFTAVSGEGYFINTTSGAITMNLPSSPSAGDIVSFKDYARTFGSNSLTVGRGGSNMDGVAADTTFETTGLTGTLIYMDATKGWSLINDDETTQLGAQYVAATGGNTTATCGNFKIHTFTGPGTLCVSSAGNSAGSNTVSYMVVAGGGGAGGDTGGGGGAGGFREGLGLNDSYTGSPLRNPTGVPVSVQGYPITIGAGGAASPSGNAAPAGGTGSQSIFSTITSAGGGGGAGGASPHKGNNGGSGGGNRETVSPDVAGSGNTPPVSPPQGQPGAIYNNPNGQRGGGGGATAAGVAGGPGAGGDGATTSINATPTAFAGGGGGGASPSPTSGGAGGGGGGKPGTGNPGTANTGGGGGGGDNDSAGGGGGSGIVIIRYKFQ
tara:strand:+ start:595 stop:1893 length:1299 start_codon:yes stop_codon:yes gene_type:complete